MKLGCAPNTVKNYIERYPELQELEREILDRRLDLAEGTLLKAMGDGNLTAVIFYLKCKGKARGYVERAELTGAGGGPIATTTQVDMTKATDEQLERLASGDQSVLLELASPSGAAPSRPS